MIVCQIKTTVKLSHTTLPCFKYYGVRVCCKNESFLLLKGIENKTKGHISPYTSQICQWNDITAFAIIKLITL